MKLYRIIQTLTVSPGTEVQLEQGQAHRRAHRLESLGGGRYRTKELLQFKRGEIIGLDADLPKVHMGFVEILDEPIAQGTAETTMTPPSSDSGKAIEVPEAPKKAPKKAAA